MAKGRKTQKLINYHSSTKNETRQDFVVENLDYGEIAVRHHVEQPELYIRTGENTYAIFCDVEATNALIIAQTSQINQDLGRLSGNVISFSGEVVSEYATKAEVVSGDNRVYGSATSYTNEVSGNIQSYILETYWTSAETQAKLNTNNSAVTILSASVIAFSGAAINYIDDKLSNVYFYKGSVDYVENLSAYTPANVGDVYNVVNANGTEGEPGYTPEGTNYAWNGSEWDALGGTIDLSNYVTVDQLAASNSALTDLTQSVGNLSGSVISFSGNVVNNYATKEEAASGDNRIYASATSYTNEVSGNIQSYILETYWTSAETQTELNTINSGITNLTQELGQLSGRVYTHVEPLAETALHSFVLIGKDGTSTTGSTSEQSGAIANYTVGSGATLDLSALVIDCGEF